ncbi:MAG: LysM peptidoglycan-binding domain-containing protein [Parcubacteria group bacterium]
MRVKGNSWFQPIPKPKTQERFIVISKLLETLSISLLGRENLKNLAARVHIIQKALVRFIKERRTIKVLHLFRNYSAFIVVASCALLVSATNFTAGRESSGFLFGYFGQEENYDNPLKDKMFLKSAKKTNVALAPLAEASTSPDPESKDEEESPLMLQGQSLIAGMSPVRKDPEEDGGVVIYEVQPGDTVSAIAASHKISVNTILWANEMDNVDDIMPGDKIFILPVSGLTYTVKKGDTIDSVSNEYKADKDKIIAFNGLPANGELKEGEEITIPDGQKEVPQATTPSTSSGSSIGIAPRQYDSFTAGKSVLSGKAGAGHSFPYGYCTWYVASRRYVPWGGNAGTWLYHAKAAGYSTGKTPRPGAIMVSSESWWGHVAIVESVSGSSFTISEMNYAGFAKRSTRTIPIGSRAVKGFVY